MNKRRFIAFGMFWFFLTLSVESGVIPIRNVIFEHRLYLPSVGFFAGLSAGLYYLIKDQQKYAIICAIIVCTFSYLTLQRNRVWQDPVSLWTDVVQKSPYKARAHYNLGLGYYHRGDYKKAFNHYNQALALRPEYFAVFNNRGLLYRKVGNNDSAMADFNRALELSHDTVAAAQVYHNRGVLYRQQRQYELALTEFNRALALNQNFAQPYISRAVIFAIKIQYDLALNDLEKAEALNPHLEDIYSNRGNIYRRQGRYDLALNEFTKALKIHPDFATPYYLRSLVYAEKGDIQQALEDALKAESLGKKISEDYINQLQMSFDRIQ